MPIIDADYDRDEWFARTKGQENEPERGARCTTCFDMRFQKTAQYASENNFDIISSTLGISRWKDMKQINDSGARSSEPHEFHIGILTGENKAARQECLRFQKRKTFISKSTVDVSTLLVILITGDSQRGRDKIERGVKFYQEAKLKLSQLD